MTPKPALLIVAHDVVGPKMAGPGIRAFHLARVLRHDLAVTLAVPASAAPLPDSPLPDSPLPDSPLPNVTCVAYLPDQWASLAPWVARADVALLFGDLAARFPQLADVEIPLIIDGYDPVLAEWLAVHAHLPLDDLPALWQDRLRRHAQQFQIGDFFICAGERQRDWWLGQLEAHGRINPATHRADPTLRRLVDVVPYGLPDGLPQAGEMLIRNRWAGIGEADKLVLWGGGLWPWLDPLTAVRALGLLQPTRPDIKLIFPGTRHPNPEMAAMHTLLPETRQLAADLDLVDKSVFFGDWIPYADWQTVLMESDVALTLHQASLETRLAFRSRVLEYLWAGLPVVATEGDATSDLVAAYGVGIQTPPGDAHAVAAALLTLADEARSTRADGFARARAELNWERAAAPLLAFCRNPQRAADRLAPTWHIPDPHTNPQPDPALVQQQAEELAHLRTLVAGYANGRVMRALHTVDRFKRRWMGSGA
jgi:glycosyltransferase involved in cell wall biosynthesis